MSNIQFSSEEHEKFYLESLEKCRYDDVYHKALCYCLGINRDTRVNVSRIYDFKNGLVKIKCINEGWQTSGSRNVVRLAFNLYNGGTPTVDDLESKEEQLQECRGYSVSDIFCCSYARFFYQAICIRYPEYIESKN